MQHTGVADTWAQGDPYEQYVGRWSRRVAPRFLSWLQIPAGRAWLDVGCGTGVLSAAILAECSPSSVTGVEPSEGFRNTAKSDLADRVDLRPGSAERIPLADSSIDEVVSGLVLNFVPDVRAGIKEMIRVARPGGIVAAYVWDYAGKMEMIRAFWDSAVELDPDAAQLDEGIRFPICRPRPLLKLFFESALRNVEVTAIDIETPFTSFEDYWLPFTGGQGPAPTYAMSLEPPARARLVARLRERLSLKPDGSVTMIARAWAVRGTVPG